MMERWICTGIIAVAVTVCQFAGDYRISCYLLCACILVLVRADYLAEKRREKNYLANMLSDISHQIKTPLTAITLMTDLLKGPGLSEERRMEFAARIDKQADKITWLVRNLLTLSRLDADMLKLKMERVEVETLLARVCQPLELLAEVKGVALTYKMPGRMVKMVAGGHNFATNIVIKDNGEGIVKEDLPYIPRGRLGLLSTGFFLGRPLFLGSGFGTGFERLSSSKCRMLA